jgi:hypothetical protein
MARTNTIITKIGNSNMGIYFIKLSFIIYKRKSIL